jgi:hypothetical protein
MLVHPLGRCRPLRRWHIGHVRAPREVEFLGRQRGED